MKISINFGWVACELSIILYILPIISFINYCRKKIKFEKIPVSRLFANYINCLIWYFYGSIKFKSEIKFANMIGAIISILLIIIYLYYELKTNILDSLLNLIIIIISTLCAFEWLGNLIIDENNVGKICLLISIISFIIIMSYVYNGVNEKKYSLIPINYPIISFPIFLCWIKYCLMFGEYYYLTTNIIGIIVSVVEIILYIYYKKEYPMINDEESETAIKIDEESKKGDNSIKAKPVKIITTDN